MPLPIPGTPVHVSARHSSGMNVPKPLCIYAQRYDKNPYLNAKTFSPEFAPDSAHRLTRKFRPGAKRHNSMMRECAVHDMKHPANPCRCKD